MTWAAVAIGGAAVVGGVAGSLISANASRSAANTQADATTNQTALQRYMFDQQFNSPYNQAIQAQGTQAVNQLGKNVFSGKYDQPFTMSDFQSSPVYQSMMGANQLLLQNAPAQYAASGMLGSGNMQSGLQEQAQMNAMQAEPAAYNQWAGEQQFGLNALQSLSGMGQSQNQFMGGLGQNYATNAGNAMMTGANAQASGMIGSANAYNNAFSNMNNQAMSGYGMYLRNQQQENMLNYLNGLRGNNMGNGYDYSGWNVGSDWAGS